MNFSSSVKKSIDHLSLKTTKNCSFITKLLRKAVIKQLKNIELGQLTLIEDEKEYYFKGKNSHELAVEIKVLNEQFYWFIAFGGSVGAGEAYINHFWQSKNLTKVVQLFAVNQSMMDNMEKGLTHFTSPLKKIFHWLNKNTCHGSRKNIIAHYDLGNDFFKLFLDPTMMYSAGIFYSSNHSMEQASINKLKKICEQLQITEKDHVIEIGTGWGGFAIYAANNYGCHVTTTTISEEQYLYTQEKISAEGLENRITLLKQDYRQLTGNYDKLVSIEMIEAVGHHYYDTFFAQCSHLLKPHGEALLQAITIPDQKFNRAKKEVDYIKRYIFPGSCIPSVNAISRSIQETTDLRIFNLNDIGFDYALTLEKWRECFFQNINRVKSQGYSDAFIRMWEFYFCYCEGGFRERVISDIQLHMIKPHAKLPSTLTKREN